MYLWLFTRPAWIQARSTFFEHTVQVEFVLVFLAVFLPTFESGKGMVSGLSISSLLRLGFLTANGTSCLAMFDLFGMETC